MLSIWGHDKESRCPSGKSACLCTFLCLEYCTLFSAFAVIDLAAFSRCYVFFCFAFFFFKSLLVSSEMASGWKMQQYWLGLKHTEARIINDHRQLPLSTCMRWSFSLLTPDYVEIQMGWFFLLLSPFFFSFSSDDQIFILLFQILFKSHIDSSPKPDHFITSAHPLNWESEITPKSYEIASIRWFIVTLVNSRPNTWFISFCNSKTRTFTCSHSFKKSSTWAFTPLCFGRMGFLFQLLVRFIFPSLGPCPRDFLCNLLFAYIKGQK